MYLDTGIDKLYLIKITTGGEGMEDKGYEIITVGVPDINSLDKAQADIFYSTLLDIILEYYKDHPEEKS